MTTTTQTTKASVIETTIDGATIKLAFINGETIVIDASKLSDDIRNTAMMHGLKQKLVDAAALPWNPETKKSATVGEKYEAVQAVAERLQAGQWNKGREGGGNEGGLLFRAMCKVYEGRRTPETLKAWLDGKSDKEKAALRKVPEIAQAIEALRPAVADAKVNDLLAELNDD